MIRKIINTKIKEDMEELYNIENFFEDGSFVVLGKKKFVLKVFPITIINSEEDFKQKTAKAYMNILKKIKGEIQIYIKVQKKQFKKEILKYKGRYENENNLKIKQAIYQYLDYLSTISQKEEMFLKEYFIVMDYEYKRNNMVEDILESFKEMGIKAIQIDKKEELENLIKNSIIKGEDVYL